MSLRRPSTVVIAVFLLLDLVLLLPGWSEVGLNAAPGAFSLDMGQWFLGLRALGREAMLSGQLPEWNPHLFAGVPYLASPQSAVFYPPNLALLPLPLPLGLALGRLAHLLAAQLGAWLLVQRLGGTHLGGLLAGVAFGLSAQGVLRIDAGHVPLLDAAAWIPWVSLAAVEASTGRVWRGVAWGVGAASLQLLAGNPQIVQVTWFGLLVLGPALGVAARQPLREVGSRAAAFFVVVPLVSALVAGPALVPAFELALSSARQGFDPAWVGQFSFGPEGALTLLAPGVFGGGERPFWGPGYAWEATVFLGLVPLVLSVWGLGRGRRAAPWGLAAAWLVLLGLGANGPLLLPLAERVPGLASFRAPVRYLIPASLFLAVLAGLGLPSVVRRRSAVGPLLLAVCAAALASAAWWAGTEAGRGWIADVAAGAERFGPAAEQDPALVLGAVAGAQAALALAACWAGVAFAVLALRRRGLLSSRRAGKLLVAVAILELLQFGSGRVRFCSSEDYRLDAELSDALARLEPGRVALLTGEEVNRPLALGLRTLSGYEGNLRARTNAFYNAWDRLPAGTRRFYRFVPRVDPVTRLLGQRNVVVPAGRGLPIAWRVEPPLRLVGRTRAAEIYRDEGALERAFVRHAVSVARYEAVLEAVTDPGFDPRGPLLLEQVPPLVPALPKSLESAPPSVDVVGGGPDQVRLRVSLAAPGFLVLGEAFDSGWSAEVAGVELPIVPAYGLIQAVSLPEGVHTVVFRYRAPGVRWALLVAALTLGAGASLARRYL